MNSSQTSSRLSAPPAYAHSVRVSAGSIVFTAGGVPLDRDGALVGEGDPERQARQVVDNLLVVLQDNDLRVDDVVKTTVFVVSADPAELALVWSVLRETGLATPSIAATLLGVAALGYPGQLVEVEVVAAA